jgi:hypothetical protein
MDEVFLIRLEGGPCPGDRSAPSSVLPWPLPDALAAPGGVYRKVTESRLPPMPPDSHVMRGAQYVWVPDA